MKKIIYYVPDCREPFIPEEKERFDGEELSKYIVRQDEVYAQGKKIIASGYNFKTKFRDIVTE